MALNLDKTLRLAVKNLNSRIEELKLKKQFI